MNRSRVFVVSGIRVVGHGRNMLRLAVFVGCHFHACVAKKRGTCVRKRVNKLRTGLSTKTILQVDVDVDV